MNDELRKRSEASGITETRILEDALKLYFKTGMEKQMASVLSAFKGAKLPFEMPVTPFISCAW